MQGLSTRIAAPIEELPESIVTGDTIAISWLDANFPDVLPTRDETFWIWIFSTFNCHLESPDYLSAPLGRGIDIYPGVTARLGPFRRESLGAPAGDPEFSTGFVLYLTCDDTLPSGLVSTCLQVIESEGPK